MKKIKYIVFALLILAIFSITLSGEEKNLNKLTLSFKDTTLFTPGELFPINIHIYYKKLNIKGNYDEKVTFRIYSIPADLAKDSYEEYCLENKPVQEVVKNVTLQIRTDYFDDKDYLAWTTLQEFRLPGVPPGHYLVTATTEKAGASIELTMPGSTGMSARVSGDSLIVFVQNRNTSAPVEGAEVTIYGKEPKKFTTDKDGVVTVNTKDLKLSGSIKIQAKNGEDTSVVKVVIPSKTAVFWSYIYTDRPIYRPGQKLCFRGILRTGTGETFTYKAQEDMKVFIKDPGGKSIYEETLKTDDFGCISGECKLPENTPAGSYSISCVNPAGQQTCNLFEVQDYKKPEKEIIITPDKDRYCNGDKMNFSVGVKYYKGDPVRDKEFTWEIRRRYVNPFYYSDEYRMGYYLMEDRIIDEPYYMEDVIGSGSSKTDKDGKSDISCEPTVYYASTYILTLRMADRYSGEVTELCPVPVTAGAFYLTVTKDKNYYKEGDKVRIAVTAKDYNDIPVKTDLSLKVSRCVVVNNELQWEDESFGIKTDENGLAYCDYTPVKDGYYNITAQGRDEKGNDVSSDKNGFYYVADKKFVWPEVFSNGEIVGDKESYEKGETANFFIISPFEGVKGLVTFEGEDIYSGQVVEFTGKVATISVKLTEEYAPLFYVTVSFLYNNCLYYQSKQVSCTDRDKILTLSIDSEDVYKPGDTAKFIIKTVDRNNRPVSSQISLGIVDEAFYSAFYLKPRPNPFSSSFISIYDMVPSENGMNRNIQDIFYGVRADHAYTYGSDGSSYGGHYSDIKGNSVKNPMPGDYISPACQDKTSADTATAPSPGSEIPYCPDTAYFNPSIITDQNGIAEVSVTLPDNLTAWRINGISVSKDTQVGENTKTISVAKDFIVNLIMPKFFVEGDEGVITGIIYNKFDKEKRGTATIKTDGGVEILDKEECNIRVPAKGSYEIKWKVKAGKAGQSEVNLAVSSDEESNSAEESIKIIPRGTEEIITVTGTTKGEAEEEINLPENSRALSCLVKLIPSVRSVIINTLNSLASESQKEEKVTPEYFIQKVIVAKTREDLNTEKADEDSIRKNLKSLYALQNSDLGWGAFRGDKSRSWETAWALHCLCLAKDAGYPVNKDKTGEAINWLKNHYEKEEDINTRVYMDYAMVLGGEERKTYLLGLCEKKKKLNNYARALLALSLQKRGLLKEAGETVAFLEDNFSDLVSWNKKIDYYRFSSSQIETASYCLEALLRIKPDSPLTGDLVRFLLANEKKPGDEFYSSGDSLASAMALTEYMGMNKEINPDFKTDLYFNGKQVNTLTFTEGDTEKEIEIPVELIKEKNKINLEMKGQGMLYYAVQMKYMAEGDKHGESSGIEIARNYYLLKGGVKTAIGEDDKVSLQDTILVELNIKTPEDYEYVIIEEPFPAGCKLDIKEAGSDEFSIREENDKLVYFFPSCVSGEKTLSYQLKPITPGTFHVLPPEASLLYSPKVYGSGDEMVLKITEKEEKQITPPPEIPMQKDSGEKKETENNSKDGTTFSPVLKGLAGLIVLVIVTLCLIRKK